MMASRAWRALIVEDEALIALTACDLLEALGCTVVGTAMDCASAVQLLESGAADLAMLDVNLGSERSDAVADRARALGIPYFFTSGYGADGVPAQHADAPVLTKPYGLSDLAQVLNGLAPS